MNMRTLVLTLLAAVMATTGLVSSAAAKPDLGTKWVVNDNSWTGVWTRGMRANSNIFHGVFTHPKHGRFTSKLIITQGIDNKFTIRRTDKSGFSKGKTCNYTGKISNDGKRVTATSSCQWAKGPWPMSGKIIGQRYREFRYPMYPGSRTHRLDTRWDVKPWARKSPGKDPAIKFCKAKGFKTAVHWDADSRSGRYKTAFIGTGKRCTKRCRGFRIIQCR